MAKDNFQKLDIINPKDMDLETLQTLMAQTDADLKALEKRQRVLDKQVRGALWLWWFLPFFGWIIYSSALNNRRRKEKWARKLIDLKQETAKKELQRIFNQKRYDQLMAEDAIKMKAQ